MTRLRIAVIVAVVTAQVALPVLGLFNDRPGRFGWQMYAANHAPITAEASLVDGRTIEVDLSEVLVRHRPELPYERLLPAHLCRVLPDAERVRVQRPHPEFDVERVC